MITNTEKRAIDRLLKTKPTVSQIRSFLREPENAGLVLKLAEAEILARQSRDARQAVREEEREAWTPPRVAPLRVVDSSSGTTLTAAALTDSGFPAHYMGPGWQQGVSGLDILTPLGWEFLDTEEGRDWSEAHETLASSLRSIQRRSEREERERAEVAERGRKALAAASRALEDSVSDAVAAWKSHLHAQWTTDLLQESFMTPRGLVLWAEATETDHRDRLAWLQQHAAGTIKTAALHQAALDDLRSSGAKTLREFVAARPEPAP